MLCDALLIETRRCSLPDLGFFAVYASVRFAQNRANDDRMRQSLLFSVCVCVRGERKAQTRGKEMELESMCVCMCGCVNVCVCVCSLKQKKREGGGERRGWGGGKLGRDNPLCPSARIYWWVSHLSLRCSLLSLSLPYCLLLIAIVQYCKFPLSAHTLWRQRRLKFWTISKRNFVLYSNCR